MMTDPSHRPPWLADLGRVCLHLAAAAALVLLLVSGLRLASEQARGLLGLRLLAFGDPGQAWTWHRSAAAALILCLIGYVLFTRGWPRPRAGVAALLALAQGGSRARAEISARLWMLAAVAVGLVVLSGTLLTALPPSLWLQHLLIALHLLGGGTLLLALLGIALVPGESGGPAAAPATLPPATGPAAALAARPVRPRWIGVPIYLAGCVMFSLGVKLFIDSHLGTDPLSAMALGIAGITDLPGVRVGLVSSLATLVMLALSWALTGRRPPLTTFLTMALVGYLTDLWNALGLEAWTGLVLAPVGQMLTGLFLDAYASALIIMSGIGCRAVDLLALALVERWRLRFVEARLLIEGGFVAVALVTGGPLGVATIAFVSIIAPFIEPFVLVNRQLLRLPYLSPVELARPSP